MTEYEGSDEKHHSCYNTSADEIITDELKLNVFTTFSVQIFHSSFELWGQKHNSSQHFTSSQQSGVISSSSGRQRSHNDEFSLELADRPCWASFPISLSKQWTAWMRFLCLRDSLETTHFWSIGVDIDSIWTRAGKRLFVSHGTIACLNTQKLNHRSQTNPSWNKQHHQHTFSIHKANSAERFLHI